jgi:hypothetical protein
MIRFFPVSYRIPHIYGMLKIHESNIDFLSMRYFLGNCDIDFFNFCHWKMRSFEILNLFKRSQNFAVIFQKYLKQNRKSTKYFKISWMCRVIPMKFREMSLVLVNLLILLTFIKSHNFMLNSVKVWKISEKYCLNDLEKQSNIALISLTFFIHALKNGLKLANFHL